MDCSLKKFLLILIFIKSALAFGQASFERIPVFDGLDEISYGDIGDLIGPGVSFADFDNDGWDDITLPASDNRDFQFLRNVGGSLELVNLPISSEGLNAKQVTWVDFDNDGDNDFFAVSLLGKCWFYRNDGGNTFTNITEISQLGVQNFEYWGVSWGDYDNDGHLDPLLIVRDAPGGNPSLLYHNNGDGTFTDVTQSAGFLLDGRLAQAASFFDYDRDGFQDILFANDRAFIPNDLYRNNGDGTFSDVSILSGMDIPTFGMSTTIDDYDNDGFLDAYITNIFQPSMDVSVIGNAFMRNNKDGTFSNIALENGTRFDGFAWGAVFLDAENDSDLDLFVSSHLNGSDGRPSSAYFENNGSGSYSVPTSIGFDADMAKSFGNAIGDINNDGLPDIVVVNTNNEPIDLWQNTSTNLNNWLKIKLQGTESNRMGIGSYIKVGVDSQTYYRYTLCGEGFISQNSNSEFIGLGQASSVDYIEVTWLSGIVDRFENINANQTITLVEGTNPVENAGNNPDNAFNPEGLSIARLWNEALLEGIRHDFARPTVHGRNLFHSAIAMYDAWAVFQEEAETVFLGKSFKGFRCKFEGIETPENVDKAIEEVMSYAMYRLLQHRFANSPGVTANIQITNQLFSNLQYDPYFTDTDYSNGSYAALGNYLAEQIINFGNQDGANEANAYANEHYQPVNEPLELQNYDQPITLNNPNRWQPLQFESFVDQSGNVISATTPPFLGPEWGEVLPFALKESDLSILNNGFDSYIYQDPGAPPLIQDGNGIDDPYKWHFSLVASWSSHLDPNDPTLIDISPGALGNVDISLYPTTFEEYKNFYNYMDGGDIGTGHSLNPFTQQPYEPQLVKRADYARALAEFWADGPDSETPPGHWFTILNYVSDHPEVNKQFGGEGPVLSDLEWDVKSYLALGGAMHDAAVNTWAIKGYYDFIRPVSAIRYMAYNGQSSDPSLPSYHPHGIPLVPGRIELIEAGDPLAGASDENVGKIKIYAWRGHDAITDPTMEFAGVGWILGTQWWPYQRPTFVTPPFAGYVSGHSTFSRAAAEVLTLLTGDEFFPGGMGTFDIEQNRFLVFEQGPSESFVLQWATYQDASEQTSLSRIWGGIHPPVDDIPGRIMGDKIGKDAFALAQDYYSGLAEFSSDNFTIEITSESCVDQNDGQISIVAKDYYNYVANLNGQEHFFNTNYTIPNLAPGEYSLCLGVTNNPSVEQCFTIIINEVSPTNVSTTLVGETSSLMASVQVEGGTPPYNLEINGIVVDQFSSKNYSASVKSGDVLKISSQIPCEGVYSEVIGLDSNSVVFTNPNTDEATIQTNGIVGTLPVFIYGMNGQLIQSSEQTVQNNQIHLSINNLKPGVYMVVLENENPVSFKMVKK